MPASLPALELGWRRACRAGDAFLKYPRRKVLLRRVIKPCACVPLAYLAFIGARSNSRCFETLHTTLCAAFQALRCGHSELLQLWSGQEDVHRTVSGVGLNARYALMLCLPLRRSRPIHLTSAIACNGRRLITREHAICISITLCRDAVGTSSRTTCLHATEMKTKLTER